MKSNLAVLSSDNKTIQFIKNNNLEDLCNLYANSSRNTDDAKLFSENHGFEKYYGSYEDLIEDTNIEYITNFLPTGIKFEYTYLALKKNKKIITNYPIISNKNELAGYHELKDLGLMSNLFLVDDQNFQNFYNESKDKKFVSYLLTFKQDQYNNLSSQDILFDLTPDLFFFIDQYKQLKPSFKSLIIKKDKITQKISFLSPLYCLHVFSILTLTQFSFFCRIFHCFPLKTLKFNFGTCQVTISSSELKDV